MGLTDNPLDAGLLRALLVLLEERSVTRAGVRLGLSQPATSLILKRLRSIFGDQLLVRSVDGMVPTERAGVLQVSAAKVLEDLDALLALPQDFDPSTSRQTFTIALPDHILPSVFNGLTQSFRRKAPLARLVLRSLGQDYDFEGALASGVCDIVISNWTSPPDYLRKSVLFEDVFVCLVDENHAFTRKAPTEQDYFAASHVAPADYAIKHRGVVETYLGTISAERERRLVTSYFAMAPYLIVGTDLVFTVTRHFATHFAGILPLTIIDCPVRYPPVQFYQLWHERMQFSPMHRWLRETVGAMRGVYRKTAG